MPQPIITVESLKYGEIPHYTYPLKLLARTPELWVLEGEFGRPLLHHTRGATFRIENRSLEFFWPGRLYNVGAEIAADGSVSRYYCNIILPPVLEGDRIRMIDLDLDLHVNADLSWEVLDRDEFAAHAIQFGYPPEVAEGAEAALRELIVLLESRAFPFGGQAERLAVLVAGMGPAPGPAERAAPPGSIRKAEPADVAAIVELSEQKRSQYQEYQPLFWRKAADSREKQSPFLRHQLGQEKIIALVHERGGQIDGFVIGAMVQSPPVYDAGLTCLVDDYCVAGQDWAGVGRALLEAVTGMAKERGALQTVVVCGHLDQPKRAMLRGSGHTIASEWWTRPV